MPRRPDLPCADCGELMWRGKGVLPAGQARCRPCRNAASTPKPKPPTKFHCQWCGRIARDKTARGQRPKWCTDCGRSQWWKYEGKTVKVRKPRPSRALVHIGPVEPKQRTTTPPVTVVGRQGEWWTSFVSGPCAWCDEHFTATSSTGAETYCSKRCQQRASRVRRGRFDIKPADRLAIYERDNWTCQLCDEAVDPSLPPSDVWAATLDHIECQSWALIPDHTPSNLRLAHRWCNSVRGDERWYDVSVLKGAA